MLIVLFVLAGVECQEVELVVDASYSTVAVLVLVDMDVRITMSL